MLQKRSGQVTLFFIIGIVLIAVVGIAFLVKGVFAEEKLRLQAEQVLTEAIQTNSIHYYVEGSLEQILTEGLIILGQTGGLLGATNYSNGTDYVEGKEFLYFNRTDNYYNQTYAVGYGIIPNTICPEVFPYAPAYPVTKTSFEELTPLYNAGRCKALKTSGYLGYNSLTKLCYFYGANSFSATEGYAHLPCDVLAFSPTEDNMQTRLEKYIQQQLLQGIDFSLYEEMLGHNITIIEEEVNTTIIYGRDTVTIESEFPFTVRIAGGYSLRTTRSFSYTLPLRLRTIYEFTQNILADDSRLWNYNLTSDYLSSEGSHHALSVQRIPNYCKETTGADNPCTSDALGETFWDDIIIVRDNFSLIDNKSYEFVVAVKNRMPVLNYTRAVGAVDYDFTVAVGDDIIISPIGIDPDDKNVTYDYEGWREDYEEYFDDTLLTCDVVTNLVGCMAKNWVIPTPRNWTRSAFYFSTKKNAYVNTTADDIGVHNVTVRIKDETGLEDYQNISILIFDNPVAVINGSNGFTTINNSFGTVEDYYILNTSGSRGSIIMGGLISTYNFVGREGADIDGDGILDDFAFETVFDDKDLIDGFYPDPVILSLPTVVDPYHVFYPLSGELAMQHLPLNTSRNNYGHSITFKSGEQPYQLELHVGVGGVGPSASYSDPDYFNLTLLPCMPYRGTGLDPNPPYPYNTTQGPYDYNHICCVGNIDTDGNVLSAAYAPSTTVCFESDLYGAYYLLDNRDLASIDNNPLIGTSIPDTSGYSYASDGGNDMYLREFLRYCDNERGNTCTGIMSDTLTLHDECNDLEAGQVERCQGPRTTVSTSNYATCIDYDIIGPPRSKSFEMYLVTSGQDLTATKSTGDVPDGFCSQFKGCAAVETGLFDLPATEADGIDPDPATPLYCRGGCDGNGDCAQAVDCSCNVDNCGAVCDVNNPFDLDGLFCRSDCTDTCTFATNEYCPTSCLRATQSLPITQGTCLSEHDRSKTEYCRYTPPGQNQCDQNGCGLYRLDSQDPLRLLHCDVCTANGVQQGEFCPTTPGYYVNPDDGVGYCYWNTANSCSGTSCSANRAIPPSGYACGPTGPTPV